LLHLKQRGPWAALLGSALLFRRWRLAVPLAFAALAVLSIRPGLGTMLVRWEVWGRTAAVILDNPLAGVGTGGYPWAPGLNTTPLVTAPVENVAFAHNEFLERAAEWGIPGGLLFLAWVLARARTSPALASMALAAVTGFTFVHPLTWALWCVLAGLQPARKGNVMADTSWPICTNCDGYATMQKRHLGPNSTRQGHAGAPCPSCHGAGRVAPVSPVPPPAPDEGTAPIPPDVPEETPAPKGLFRPHHK